MVRNRLCRASRFILGATVSCQEHLDAYGGTRVSVLKAVGVCVTERNNDPSSAEEEVATFTFKLC